MTFGTILKNIFFSKNGFGYFGQLLVEIGLLFSLTSGHTDHRPCQFCFYPIKMAWLVRQTLSNGKDDDLWKGFKLGSHNCEVHSSDFHASFQFEQNGILKSSQKLSRKHLVKPDKYQISKEVIVCVDFWANYNN